MSQIIQVKIDSEYILLGQLIKLINLVSSGGEAKRYLLQNKVLINDIEENKRGRKIYKNDRLIINKQEYEIC